MVSLKSAFDSSFRYQYCTIPSYKIFLDIQNGICSESFKSSLVVAPHILMFSIEPSLFFRVPEGYLGTGGSPPGLSLLLLPGGVVVTHCDWITPSER